MSGGATFTPRIYPRPTPLSSFKVYSRATLRHIRGPLLAVGVTFATRPLYNQLSNCFHSDRLFFSFSTTLVHFFVYLTVNTFFYLLDRNCWLLHYKLDRKRAQLPSTALMRSTLIEAIVSQLVLGPLLLYCIFPLFKYFGQPGRDQPLPSIMELMRMYVLCVFSNDWGFYWSHRTFHCKAIYKFFHKTHHKYLGTVSFAAEYAHPLEQLFANHLPTAMACLCFGFPIHVCFHQSFQICFFS